MDVRRQVIRRVERAHAHELEERTGAGVVAPHGDAAARTPGDLLSQTALGGRIDDLGLAGEQHDAIGFDHRIQRERGARLALAPAAMAAMDEQRRRLEAVTDVAAGARSGERGIRGFFATKGTGAHLNAQG